MPRATLPLHVLVAVALWTVTPAGTTSVEATDTARRHVVRQQKPTSSQSATQPNARAAATRAFLDRINEYVEFHNRVQKVVPALDETSNPAEIAEREAALGRALIERRPDAREGDFFIEQYRPLLIEIIEEDFARRPPAARKALVAEIPADLKIGVNMVYPTDVPLATFPASLLKKLPELPQELEYRIVGRHLILRDVQGNVIVDVLRGVIPIPE